MRGRCQPRQPTLEDFRLWCQEFDTEVAHAITTNTFYHVTTRAHLQRIREQGCRPQQHTGISNFTDVYVDRECVYLWPTVAAAQSYAWNDHGDRFDPAERVILEIRGVDLSQLYPDQEFFAHSWNDFDPEDDVTPVSRFLRAVSDRTGADIHAPESITFERAGELVRSLSPKDRMIMANFAAVSGDALMVRQTISPEQIRIVEAHDYDTLWEMFCAENPQPDRDLSDDELELREQAFEDWLHETGHWPAPIDEMKAALQDPDQFADPTYIEHYRRRDL